MTDVGRGLQQGSQGMLTQEAIPDVLDILDVLDEGVVQALPLNGRDRPGALGVVRDVGSAVPDHLSRIFHRS